MNTQPTNEFLNHERLTDLAQFAVPDGHDLWPRIEHAARASATLMAVPRPGFMSLGLSRAWTAVGILFIAATFAALGFGLAVLVLSNGHDQVPAAPVTPTVTPAADATSTPAPALSPTPAVSFEDSLSGDDLARFQTLPVEIQEALVDESLDSGNDSALRYLRDMPDDPPPLAEILDPESRALFDTIDEPYRRELLLKGYPNSTVRYERKRWLAGDLTDLEYKYGNFHVLVRGVIGTLSAKGHALPPLEETLSPAALTRFESLDPILQEAFRLDWETTRSHSVDDTADELEQDLLKAPLEMPGIRDLGLPSEAAAVLEREPALWLLAQRMVAGELVQGRNWDADDAAYLQRTIAAHEAPGGKEALERDLLPGGSGPWLPLLCNSSSQGGVPLDKAVLPSFRDLHPAQFVYAWPDPEDALSEKALANFNLLDETMLEAFEFRWYGHGLPVEARFMACLIAQWDRGLADILYTSMPGPDVLLPEDKRPFYNELTDGEKWAVNLNLAHDILMGEVIFKRDQSAFSATEHVSTFDSTPEEFLEGLRFAAVEWLCGFHPPACGAATRVSTTSQTSTIPSRELAHAKLEAILTDETLDRYRALPPAYQEALGLYTWHALPHDHVRSAVEDKIDQWGDAVIPLPELLGEERAERFDGLQGEIVNHAPLLVSYYVLVLNAQSSDESRAEAMQQYVDYIAPPDTNIPSPSEPDQDTSGPAEAPMVAWPPLDKVLTDTALARLDLLGPRLRERVTDMHSISSTGESDIKNVASFLTHYELLLLKAQPHLEIPTLEETLTGDDLAAFRALSPTDRDRAESSFQGALFALHYTLAASHPTNLTIPKPTPDFLAGQADFTMEFVTSARKEETASPIPDSWVSENGFIQFTTGDATFDEPLPGTHPWCFPPTRAPENPGPWLVPSELPKDMEQIVRNQLSTHSVLRAFQNSTDRVSMSQTLCATQRLSPVTYRAVPVGYRTAYVTAAVRPSADGVTPEFDPNVARSLVMDIGYGVVSFNVFGSLTVDELVSMAASLVPEELTDADTGPYPQIVLDGLGTSFGPIYVPGKLPDGYEMFGQLVPQPHGAVKASQLTYMRTRGNDCHFYLRQAAPGEIFPDVAAPAVVIDGVSLKTTHTPPLRPAEQYTTVHFKFQDIWIGVTISRSSTCDHSLEMVAEIAASLEPLPESPTPTVEPTPQDASTNTPRIAFHSNRDGNWNIYVMNADGSDQTRLTDDPAADSWPSWSPDGRRIAFISSRDDPDPNDDDRIWEIYVMNADGSGQTRLTNDSAWHSLPRWSPDGRRIAFQSYTDGNWEIYVMNADGSGRTRLTDNSVPDGRPTWSPDSQRIAFHSTIDENAEIYVVNADGSNQANLTNNAANDWSPSWSPDGQRIAFHSYRDENFEIYVMNADGSGQTRLTHNPARDNRPVWSSDGQRIAFTSNRDDPDPDDDNDIRNIYVINPDGSGQTRLTNESSINYASSWSPN